MASSRRWSQLSAAERTAIVTVSAAELALTTAAAVDLYRRPQERIRGGKRLWWFGIFIQPFGPIAYLAWARRG